MSDENRTPSLMGVGRLEAISPEDSRAYVAARALISQIVAVLSSRASDAAGDEARELIEAQLRYRGELQTLGTDGGVRVEQVLAEYPDALRRLSGDVL